MPDDKAILREQLDKALTSGTGPKLARLALTLLSGLPFGSIASGVAAAWSEKEAENFQRVTAVWLSLQEDELKEIGRTLFEIVERLDLLDKTVQDRIESIEYLKLIKTAFRDWSAAESEQKRVLIRNLLTNAATTDISSDMVIRLFMRWIDEYSELHLAVVGEVSKAREGITRRTIWRNLHGEPPNEDSAEADLFKLAIRDLGTGGIVRQVREVDASGRYLRRLGSSDTFDSYFDSKAIYVLTELGKQFVQYTISGDVPRRNMENL